MFSTKEEFQKEGLRLLQENNYTGTIVADTGASKSKIAIDAIKEGKFKNILITSPRTNLKQNWKDELEKWGIMETPLGWWYDKIFKLDITLDNIQTCYKWSKEQLQQFDLVIVDEVHTIGQEYSAFITIARELGISCIGLTATPDKSNEFKKEVLYKTLPILIEYHSAEKDGLINKVNYIIYEHYLNDNNKVLIKTKTKEWYQGEKSRYNYIENIFNSSKLEIENYYFNEIKKRFNTLNTPFLKPSYKRFFIKITSKDLEYFRKIYWQAMKAKKLPLDLYKYLRQIAGNDYAKFGLKAEWYVRQAPEELKPLFYKYIWARDERKQFLWNLQSTANISIQLKNKILQNTLNKVLLFSEYTSQAEKLSQYFIHSNTGNNTKETLKLNQELLSKFNCGEISELASVRSLTLGLNLSGANYGILESYSGSDTQSKQRKGRLHRLDKEDFANIIIIVVKDTQCETWFNSAFSYVQNPRIIKSVDEL